MEYRRPTPSEALLLRELAEIAGIEKAEAWIGTARLRDLRDGGMGSFELAADPSLEVSRGKVLRKAAVQFTDADGVEVIASLNARADGVPIEVDIWKTDFSPLVRIPSTFRRLDDLR